jgi:hypothetical protein
MYAFGGRSSALFNSGFDADEVAQLDPAAHPIAFGRVCPVGQITCCLV